MRRDLSDRRDQFGERDELMAEAQEAHSAKSRSNYVNHIYGLKKSAALRCCCCRALRSRSLAIRTDLSRKIRSRCTPTRCCREFRISFRSAESMLGGVCWITHRREEVAEAEGKRKEREAQPMKMQTHLLEAGLPGHHGRSASTRPYVRFSHGLGASPT